MKVWNSEGRAQAKAIMGRPARVALAVWVMEQAGHPFFQTEAVNALAAAGEARSAVVDELARFVEWGLLERSEPGASQRRVYYSQDKTSPAWEIFAVAGTVFGLMESNED